MATPGHSKAARVYFDHFRLSATASTSDETFTADAVEVPVLEGNPKVYLQGKPGGTCTVNGPMDIADDGWDEIEFGYLDDGIHYVTHMPVGSSITSIAYDTQQESTGDSRAYDQAGIGMLNWNGQITGQFLRGKVLTTGEKGFTAASSDTGVNIGVTAATETFIACIRCVTWSGFTDVTFQIDESSDDGSGDAYAQITGTTITVLGNATGGTDDVTFTGTGVAWITKTGATEAWKRLTASAVTGAGTATMIGTVGKALE